MFLSLEGSRFQIRNNEIPKMIYSTVHTGPNNQFGGLNEGLFSVAYHPETPDAVYIPAVAPTPSVNINETASLIICGVFIND